MILSPKNNQFGFKFGYKIIDFSALRRYYLIEVINRENQGENKRYEN